jgi:hypothetical protein
MMIGGSERNKQKSADFPFARTVTFSAFNVTVATIKEKSVI